ncbi:hypothetical protein [Halostagnicola larsenii]|uniref:hypothetical protein n=1 Tax=Halostagnicola larsenii TaxID=353800 RepID=UPI0012FCAB3C|nr:hypothetical protein [Halostagnicola larsenii]
MSERAKERRLARMRFPARHVCENTLFEVSGREGDICPFCGGRLTRGDRDA